MNGRKYEVRYRLLTFMAAIVSQNGRFRAVFLSVIMVLMTQVGYTDNMDFSIGLNQDTESKDTGGSTPALTPSVEGADLMVGDFMDDITFQYNASAASGSGSNSNSGTYNGNGTAWMGKDINTGTSNNGGSMSAMYLEQDAVMGNEMYFFATDSTNGYELWKSDGTEEGTVLVRSDTDFQCPESLGGIVLLLLAQHWLVFFENHKINPPMILGWPGGMRGGAGRRFEEG